MTAKSSQRPGQTGTYCDRTLAYFAEHAVDPEIAQVLGVADTPKGISIPYRDGMGRETYRRERDIAKKKTYQPTRQSLDIWQPVGTPGWLLVCEGESDCMAAISALYELDPALTGEPDHADDPPEILLRRKPDLPPPLAEATPVALPGAGGCHRQLADLAEELVSDVVLALDGDKAGRAASAKLAEDVRGRQQHVTVASLSDGRDLADLLAAADDPTAALAELIAEAEATVEEVPVEDDAAEAALEPLPNDVVAGLLDQVATQLARYVVLPGEHESVALSLFVAHTWAIGGAHATPYMLVVSPEKRSGKSRLLQVVEQLVARPWGVIGASEAAMFRKIAKDNPTLLLDEIDAIFGANSERTEPVRAILNAGNRPGATVARCVGENKDVEDFPIFCAKVLAGIDSGHRIPDTIRDRAVTVHMQRKTGAEPVERFRYRDANAEAQPIRDALERWAVGAVDLLLEADPALPQELDDRAAEAWEPMLAISDMAGGDWPRRAREAAISLSGQDDRDEVTTGTLLLGALRSAFADADRMATTTLLDAINADDDLPFGGWRDGKGLDGRRLAKLLKPYGVRPRTIRFGEHTEKGYLAESLAEAWERWLPTCSEPSQASHPSHDGNAVTTIPLQQADVTDVTDVTATAGSNGTVTATEAEEDEIERIAAKVGRAS